MKQFSNTEKKYDLEERTAKFAESIIELVRKLPNNNINRGMIEQIVSSAGSIGANYCEANESESKKDFRHKIAISKKEIKETQHWLRLLAYANVDYKEDFKNLWVEAHELLLIFSRIYNSSIGRGREL
jgi:four helix bundle protein